MYLFTLKYLTGLRGCNDNPRYTRPVAGRPRHACTPLSPVDFFTAVPLWLHVAVAHISMPRTLRFLRLHKARAVGGLYAIVGVRVFALPTAILAASMRDRIMYKERRGVWEAAMSKPFVQSSCRAIFTDLEGACGFACLTSKIGLAQFER